AAAWRAGLVSVLFAMMASAVACSLLAVAVCLVAHGPWDPPLARDLPASFGVSFVGGAAYAAFFSTGSALGRGAMRGVFLIIDWIVGAEAGFGALFTPRGHAMSLLGGSVCFSFFRGGRSVVLCALFVADPLDGR